MAQKTFSPISEAQIKKASIATLADRPNSVSRYGDGGLSAQELKERFDAFPALVQKKINEIIEALASGEAAKYITLNEKSNVLQRDNLYDFIALFSEDSGDNETIADFIEAFYTMDGDMRPDSYSLKEIFADITARFATINADVSKVSSDISAQSDRIATNEQKTQANAQNIASMQQAITQRDTQISSHEERITGIERYLGGDNFIVDDSTAYEKTVPKNACEKAKVLSIGGMTYKKKTDDGNLMPYPYVGIGGLDYKVANGAITVTSGEETDFIISSGDAVYPAGTYVFEVGEQESNYVQQIGLQFYGTAPTVTRLSNYKCQFTATSNFTITRFTARISSSSSQQEEFTVTLYPMLYKADAPITWQPRGYWLSHTKVKAIKSKSKNLLNLIGWSATADKKVLNNPFGTTVSSLEGNHITVSQSNYPNASNLASYENGFFMFFPDKYLVSGKNYKVSFDLRIINNPLNASFIHIVSNDYWNGETQIDISKTNSVQRCSGIITYNINPSHTDYCYFECRNCGISFEIGNAMITEADVEDIEYSPYGAIDTFAIPETVQAREGYGLGMEGYPNTVEYANGRVNLDKRVKMGVVSKIARVSWINYSNVEFYAFNMPSDYIGYKTDAFMLEGFNKKPSHSNWDSADFIGVATGLATEYEIWVGFPKGTTQTEAEEALLGKSLVYALATPEIEDITNIMPKQNLIKVLGGCRIVSENEQSDPVPFSIKYLVTYPKGG